MPGTWLRWRRGLMHHVVGAVPGPFPVRGMNATVVVWVMATCLRLIDGRHRKIVRSETPIKKNKKQSSEKVALDLIGGHGEYIRVRQTKALHGGMFSHLCREPGVQCASLGHERCSTHHGRRRSLHIHHSLLLCLVRGFHCSSRLNLSSASTPPQRRESDQQTQPRQLP